tara:strand:- start:2160 stop:2330 length:171 start_codon:yes stop_codon:yes gene_type:complete
MDTTTAILLTQLPIAIAAIIIAIEVFKLKKDFVKILNKLVEISKKNKDSNKHQKKH